MSTRRMTQITPPGAPACITSGVRPSLHLMTIPPHDPGPRT
jgi:hypothetical protein